MPSYIPHVVAPKTVCHLVLVILLIVIASSYVLGFLPQGFPRKNPCLSISFISDYYLTSDIQSQVAIYEIESDRARVRCAPPHTSSYPRRIDFPYSRDRQKFFLYVRIQVTPRLQPFRQVAGLVDSSPEGINRTAAATFSRVKTDPLSWIVFLASSPEEKRSV